MSYTSIVDILNRLNQCPGFDWDEGNILKIWEKHRVAPTECEQAFFNKPLIALPDEKHSEHEERLFALSQTDKGRQLFVAFTVRNNLIRVISARDMSKKERKVYEQL